MIYLLRHGQTVWNSQGRKQGHRDSPLTWTGITQARTCGDILARRIERPGDFAMISSPLGRAWQTAAVVADALGLEPDGIRHERRLMEVAFGDWEGRTFEEIETGDPEEWARRRASRWTHRPPGGGESYADVAERVGAWLAEQQPGVPLIVVAHGLLNRVLMGIYEGLPNEAVFNLEESQDAVFLLNGGGVEKLVA